MARYLTGSTVQVDFSDLPDLSDLPVRTDLTEDVQVLADRIDRAVITDRETEDVRQLLREIRELLITDRERPALAELPGLAAPGPAPVAMGPFVMQRRAAM